jgi:ABC-type sugar transport system substrate-binding protein
MLMIGIPTNHRRLIVALGVVIASSLALTACSSGSPASTSSAASSTTIGFSPYNQSAASLIGMAKGVQATAKGEGVTAIIADPNNSPTKQAQQIQSWMNLGQVKGLWTLALDPSTIKPLIPLAKTKNVAMITSGTYQQFGLSGPPVNVTFDAINYTDFGTQMGEQLGKCANERLGGKGVFLYLTNAAGSVGKADQDKAVIAGLAKVSPGSKIVATTTFGGVQLTAQQNTLTAIQAHPDLNGSVGGTDESALGPLQAFKQANKYPLKQCIIGAGGNDEALADVKARTIYADVTIQFGADLAQCVKELIYMTKHLGTKGTQLYTPIKTVSK